MPKPPSAIESQAFSWCWMVLAVCACGSVIRGKVVLWIMKLSGARGIMIWRVCARALVIT